MGTTATLTPTGVGRRGKPQQLQRPIRTTATMATATVTTPTMAMATGAGRGGRRKLTPFLILSQLRIQTQRRTPTMATMATGAGILLTMGTPGRTITADTTGAVKYKS